MTTIALEYTTKKADEGKEEAFRKIERIASAVREVVDKQPGSQGFVTFCRDVLRDPNRDLNVSAISSNADQFTRILFAAMGGASEVPENDMGDSSDAKRFIDAITKKVNVDKFRALLATVDPPTVDPPTVDPPTVDPPTVDTTALVTAIADLADPDDVDTTALNTTTHHGVHALTNIVNKAKTSNVQAHHLLGTEIDTLKQSAEIRDATMLEKDRTIEALQGDLASKNELLAQKNTENQTLTQKLAEVTSEHEKILETLRNAPDGSPARNFTNSFMASPPGIGRKRALGEFLEAKQIESIPQVTDNVKRTNAFDEPIEGIGADVFSKLNPKEMKNANKTLRSFFKTTDGTILQVDFNPTNEHILVSTAGGFLPNLEHFKNTLAECIKATANASASAE
jgi:hypothetical protein